MTLKKALKDTTKLGVGSMVGLSALGALQGTPGMPSEAGRITQIAGAGFNLMNIGQLGKTAMGLTGEIDKQSKTKKSKSIQDKLWR